MIAFAKMLFPATGATLTAYIVDTPEGVAYVPFYGPRGVLVTRPAEPLVVLR